MKKIKIISSILLPISSLSLISISCNNQKQETNKKEKIDISKLNLEINPSNQIKDEEILKALISKTAIKELDFKNDFNIEIKKAEIEKQGSIQISTKEKSKYLIGQINIIIPKLPKENNDDNSQEKNLPKDES